ncbi:hypothetical protein AVEN_238508-1 [Araneus ventricosus]|uniref:Uncharacterized protein n=1 Tax=Araneus ventricosus TaxID=182803 RepID=A0A4Y2LN24_ARAVE|nr:hypothetical protein AVEN_238508-1 [Araneus ventricosus]
MYLLPSVLSHVSTPVRQSKWGERYLHWLVIQPSIPHRFDSDRFFTLTITFSLFLVINVQPKEPVSHDLGGSHVNVWWFWMSLIGWFYLYRALSV